MYATLTEYKNWLGRVERREVLRTAPWKLALVAGETVTEPLLQLFRKVGWSLLKDIRNQKVKKTPLINPTDQIVH